MIESVVIFLAAIAAGITIVVVIDGVDRFSDHIVAVGQLGVAVGIGLVGVRLLVGKGGLLGAVGIALICVGGFGVVGSIAALHEALDQRRK